jgi:hypothetical protein
MFCLSKNSIEIKFSKPEIYQNYINNQFIQSRKHVVSSPRPYSFRLIFAIYYENIVKYIDILCGQNAEFATDKTTVCVGNVEDSKQAAVNTGRLAMCSAEMKSNCARAWQQSPSSVQSGDIEHVPSCGETEQDLQLTIPLVGSCTSVILAIAISESKGLL